MLDNIIGAMKEVIASASGAIATPIIYQHKSNTEIISTTNTLATTESLKNYIVDGETLSDARQFILSPLMIVEGERNFLNLEAKMHDTILYNSKVWYVLTTSNDEVELTIVCTSNKQTLSTPTRIIV